MSKLICYLIGHKWKYSKTTFPFGGYKILKKCSRCSEIRRAKLGEYLLNEK